MKLPQEESKTKENPHHAGKLLRALMSLNCPVWAHLGLPNTLPLPLMNGLTAPLTLALTHPCAPSVCHQHLLGPPCCPMAQLRDCCGTALWWGSHCLVPALLTAPYLGAAAYAIAFPKPGAVMQAPQLPYPNWATPQLPQAMGPSLLSLPGSASQLQLSCQTLQESMACEEGEKSG